MTVNTKTDQNHPHLDDPDWLRTPDGRPRGYILPSSLAELWFHTGTACNLRCPFCLEGSQPGNHRLEQISLADATPFIEEAIKLGVEQFSFTGGEPFVNRELHAILALALQHRPCLVLTNGTKPTRARFEQIQALRSLPCPLRFRISFDYPDPAKHDANRGEGNFRLALQTLADLHQMGFQVSIARLSESGENAEAVNSLYRSWFEQAGVSTDTRIVVFPEFFPPGTHPEGVPEITESCMTTYQTAASRARFMCSYSKMVVKRGGKMRVYACTLVDDDESYELGDTLAKAQQVSIRLRHHRCFSCFAHGASCSES